MTDTIAKVAIMTNESEAFLTLLHSLGSTKELSLQAILTVKMPKVALYGSLLRLAEKRYKLTEDNPFFQRTCLLIDCVRALSGWVDFVSVETFKVLYQEKYSALAEFFGVDPKISPLEIVRSMSLDTRCLESSSTVLPEQFLLGAKHHLIEHVTN